MQELNINYNGGQPRILLAPLAGITDMAFRELCAGQGASLTFTEMASAKALQFGNARTYALLAVSEAEGKAGVQLFGREPEIIAAMAARLEQECGERIALFDVNMGCPAPKIVNNGEGAALMREPELAARIVAALKGAVSRPVTAKFRKGFDEASANAVDFARRLEDAGADGITIHGRTRAQYYEGKADWGVIADVKAAVRIPVVGNGDVFTPEDAERMLRETGVDGVMVARGALGNPFLFGQIRAYLETGQYETPALEARIRMAIHHAELACAYKGEYVAIREMRKHGAWYIKGMHGAARRREALVQARTMEEFTRILTDFLK